VARRICLGRCRARAAADGQRYADFFEVKDGVMPFPGWDPFEGADSADLDEEARRAFTSAAIPVTQPAELARLLATAAAEE
jgi:hypothetical protein